MNIVAMFHFRGVAYIVNDNGDVFRVDGGPEPYRYTYTLVFSLSH